MSEETIIFLLENIPGIIFSLIMGLGFGTYATLAVYRLPRGMEWVGRDTRCLTCDHKLVLKDFFPILSLFFTKGKCRYCHAPIELKGTYLFTETAITLLCVLSFICFGFGDVYLLITALCVCAIIITATDLDSHMIPDKTLIVMVILGVMYRTLQDGNIFGVIEGASLASLIALIVRYVYFFIKGQKEIGLDFIGYEQRDHFRGPGFGYVKLTAVIGIWLGFKGIITFVPLALAMYLLYLPIIHFITKGKSYPLTFPLITSLLLLLFLPKPL